MFDLEPRVHFKEIKAAVGAGDELHRAGAGVADDLGERDGLFAHRLAHFGGDEGRRGFLHDLLVTALDRTVALVQVDDVAMGITDQLDFDMARLFDEFFDEHPVITEAGQRLALDAFKAFADIGFAPRQPHAFAAAAGAGLHHHRIADAAGDFDGMVGAVDFPDKTRDDRNARSECAAL